MSGRYKGCPCSPCPTYTQISLLCTSPLSGTPVTVDETPWRVMISSGLYYGSLLVPHVLCVWQRHVACSCHGGPRHRDVTALNALCAVPTASHGGFTASVASPFPQCHIAEGRGVPGQFLRLGDVPSEFLLCCAEL